MKRVTITVQDGEVTSLIEKLLLLKVDLRIQHVEKAELKIDVPQSNEPLTRTMIAPHTKNQPKSELRSLAMKGSHKARGEGGRTSTQCIMDALTGSRLGHLTKPQLQEVLAMNGYSKTSLSPILTKLGRNKKLMVSGDVVALMRNLITEEQVKEKENV